jgi:hypothetical protein
MLRDITERAIAAGADAVLDAPTKTGSDALEPSGAGLRCGTPVLLIERVGCRLFGTVLLARQLVTQSLGFGLLVVDVAVPGWTVETLMIFSPTLLKLLGDAEGHATPGAVQNVQGADEGLAHGSRPPSAARAASAFIAASMARASSA